MARNPPVAAILIECALAVGRGVGSKEVLPAASEFWRLRYEQSIANALFNGGNWSTDRRAVLLMSLKLGRKARSLAGAGKITKTVAKKAAVIIAQDPTCGAGGGRYCPV